MSDPSLSFTRRRFLQLAAMVSAGAALPVPVWAGSDDEIFDGGSPEVPQGIVGDLERVLVVGSGFAGLAAANALANAGIDVTVLETRDRVGGRGCTRDLGGIPVDQGCSWIHGPIGNPMAQWARLLGVSTRPALVANDVNLITHFDAATGPVTLQQMVPAYLSFLAFPGQLPALSNALGPRATVGAAIEAFLATQPLTPEILRRVDALLRYFYETGYAGAADDIGLAPLLAAPPPGGDAYTGPTWFLTAAIGS